MSGHDEWVVLGLSEDEIWEALERAYQEKHGVDPDLNNATLHGADEKMDLVYTARALREEYEAAMLERLTGKPKESTADAMKKLLEDLARMQDDAAAKRRLLELGKLGLAAPPPARVLTDMEQLQQQQKPPPPDGMPSSSGWHRRVQRASAAYRLPRPR